MTKAAKAVTRAVATRKARKLPVLNLTDTGHRMIAAINANMDAREYCSEAMSGGRVLLDMRDALRHVKGCEAEATILHIAGSREGPQPVTSFDDLLTLAVLAYDHAENASSALWSSRSATHALAREVLRLGGVQILKSGHLRHATKGRAPK